MEYLEETYADKFNCKSLLPGDAYDRAIVREIVNLIVCDIHPIQNMRVLEAVGEEKKVEWAKSWILRGFEGKGKLILILRTFCYPHPIL